MSHLSLTPYSQLRQDHAFGTGRYRATKTTGCSWRTYI